MTGRKDDGISGGEGDMKPRWDLLPMNAMFSVVDVLTHGAKKYGAENWRGVKDARRRYWRAGLGHGFRWLRGEDVDPETGLPTLAHAVCCFMFLLEMDLAKPNEVSKCPMTTT